MQRLLYAIFISFFLIISCARSKPSGIVSDKKMTEILTEVSLIDGYLNILPSDSAKKVMPVLYAKLFKDFGIDSAEFMANLNYYFGNPELTEKMYDVVNTKLKKYESQFRTEDSIVMVKQQDSLMRVSFLQKQYSNIENLKYYSGYDTIPLNYLEHTKRVFSASELQFIVNTHPYNSLNIPIFQKSNLSSSSYYFNYVTIDTTQADTIARNEFLRERFTILNKLGINVRAKAIVDEFTPASEKIPTVVLDRGMVEPRSAEESPISDTLQPKIDSVNKVMEEARNMKPINPATKPINRRLIQ